MSGLRPLGLVRLLALTLLPTPLVAQVSLLPVVGVVQYDAGFDDRYFMWGVQARYHLSRAFRIGVLGTTAHIGYPVKGGVSIPWNLPTTDESIWRIAAFAEVAIPVFSRISVTARGGAGIFHSSGVDFDETYGAGDPFYGVVDDPTGPAFGGGVGLEFQPHGPLRVTIQANVWRDRKNGGDLTDPELLAGIGMDL